MTEKLATGLVVGGTIASILGLIGLLAGGMAYLSASAPKGTAAGSVVTLPPEEIKKQEDAAKQGMKIGGALLGAGVVLIAVGRTNIKGR